MISIAIYNYGKALGRAFPVSDARKHWAGEGFEQVFRLSEIFFALRVYEYSIGKSNIWNASSTG